MRLLVPGFSVGMPSRRLMRLADYYGLPLVSFNSLITSAIRAQTCLGIQARACLENGRLIPEALALQLLEERLTEPGLCNDWVVSGFPRNIAQATALNDMLSDIGQPYDMALYLDSNRDRSTLSGSASQLTYATHPDNNNIKKTPLANFYIQHGLFFKIGEDMAFSKICNPSQLSPNAFSEV